MRTTAASTAASGPTVAIAGSAATVVTAGSVVTVGSAVTVAIDMPLHGSRANGSTRTPDTLVYNFLNPAAARDNFMQGAADFMSLVYWAETYTLAAASSSRTASLAGKAP